jgi:septal ring factor EnvC (AmiA/AmiB activator)
MPETDDIDALFQVLAHVRGTEHHRAALTALVAERNKAQSDFSEAWRERSEFAKRIDEADAEILALRKRVAELEANPPADRDRELRERLDTTLAWMAHVTDMLIRLPHTDHARIELENRLDRAVNAAMRKGDGDGK